MPADTSVLSARTPAPTAGVFAFPHIGGWGVIALAIALLTVVPVAVIFSSWLKPEADILGHLTEFVLPELLSNTFWLLLGVGIGVTVLGVSLAWLTAMCEFPGRKFYSWALLLPLAVPAYVLAFVMIGLLDYTGPLQTWLRELFGPMQLPQIRSRGGVIFVMSLALYPYVYLIARNAFLTQGRAALEAAQSLGLNRWQGFRRVALPMARPWIAAGLALALMETLADFGTVAIFNYDTFTTAIYKAWFSLFSLSAASQLSSILILFVLILALAEQRTRSHMKYAGVGRAAGHNRIRLSRGQALGATFYAGLVFAVAFLIPLVQLLLWAGTASATDLDSRYWEFVRNSLMLSGLGAAIVCTLALLLGYAGRQRPGPWMPVVQRVATIGYAFPGTVLAVGIFIPVAWLDNIIIDLLKTQGWQGSEVLKGTLLVMLLAYAVRFLAVGFGPVDSGLQRVTRNIDEAARVMGTSTLALLSRVHLPMLKASLFTAAALAFVDIMKEMPITLMTRPFGWDTLAVRVFEMTSEGEWERAALPSVAIILAGLVPIIFLAGRGDDANA
ncbi:MAG: iron ABC transporter permease [Pseudomonadota bacterium]